MQCDFTQCPFKVWFFNLLTVCARHFEEKFFRKPNEAQLFVMRHGGQAPKNLVDGAVPTLYTFNVHNNALTRWIIFLFLIRKKKDWVMYLVLQPCGRKPILGFWDTAWSERYFFGKWRWKTMVPKKVLSKIFQLYFHVK